MDECDIAIIGAGAAGLATAIFAAEAGFGGRIVILDGAKKIGAKILVSGGGRCNVTHDHVTADDYSGPRNIVRNIFRGFDEQATVRWMASLGVELKREETGKLFPVSDDAHAVLDALVRRCEQLGVEVRADHRVKEITPKPGHGHAPPEYMFTIDHTHGELNAQKVVLATGGRSLPRTGSDGFGYELARKLGHTVTATYPALVPLVLDDRFFHAALSGVSHDAELSTFADGNRIDRRAGSLLWTHFGISGPLAMDASRFWVIAAAEHRQPELRCSFIPGAFEAIEKWLIDAAAKSPKRSVVNVLGEKLPQRLADELVGYVQRGAQGGDEVHPHPGPAGSLPQSRERGWEIGQLSREIRRALVHAITALPLPVVRDRGWNYAEVTAGGVPMSEVDHRTMQSRLTPGLHLVGEILDVDGRIGGFNFQWAWSTAHAAGQAMAKRG